MRPKLSGYRTVKMNGIDSAVRTRRISCLRAQRLAMTYFERAKHGGAAFSPVTGAALDCARRADLLWTKILPGTG